MVPDDAEILVVPVPLEIPNPVLAIVATDCADDAHVTDVVMSFELPSV